MPNITSMAESAEEERRHRTRQYLITMAIRSACVLSMVFVRGPWLFVVAAGAIFLPWIAVVIANHVRQRRIQPVLRPESSAVEQYRDTISSDQWYMPNDTDSHDSAQDSDSSQNNKENPR
ncbi:DUF3099 domain-containing protein [Gulosibacter chungangensis]|uniref:DUF3099 domain-containing protein n=1 Tax=Gulosibacter chungangensis TaxID=979746 RepID=UPI001787AB38|nr:DUF3099 domain-containing protein [Gulosibacter chungangensis]